MPVYVANSGSNTVSVIDQTTNTVTATIPGFSNPQQLDATPDGQFVYVANLAASTVSVIGTATNTIVATIPVGGGPQGVSVNPSGTRVYVTNSVDNTVSVIDVATNTVIQTIPVGVNPVGVDVTPNGAFVYVANQQSNTVSVIRAEDGAVIANVPVDVQPIGVVASPDGKSVYVTTRALSRTDIISTASLTVTGSFATGISPIGIATNGRQIFVANEVSGNLTVVNVAGNTSGGTLPTGTFPQYIAVTPDGAFLYVSTRTNVVSVISLATGTVIASVPVGDQSIGIVVVPKYENRPSVRAEKTINGVESVNANPGETVFIQVRVTNTGNTVLSQVRLTDVLSANGQVLLDETIPFLSPGESVNRQFPFVVPSSGLSVLTDVFTVSEPDVGIREQAQANIAISQPTPGVTVVKEADRSSAVPGETVVYTYTVTNTGNSTLTNVTVTDEMLGLNETISSLPPGQTATYNQSFTIPQGTPAGTAVTNTVFVSSQEGAMGTDSVTVSVAPVNLLSFFKTVEPAQAAPQESVTYLFIVQNRGNTTLTNFVLQDPLLGVNVTIDELAPGERAVREAIFIVPADAAADSIIRNTAAARSDQTPELQASAELMVSPSPAFIVRKRPSRTEARPGETVQYTIEVINTGNATLTGLKVDDDAIGLHQTVASLSPGGRVTFTGSFVIPANALAGTIISNTVAVVSSQTGERTDTENVIVTGVPSLSLAKSVNPASAGVGETVQYTFTVTNTGNETLRDVRLLDSTVNLDSAIPDLAPGASETRTIAFVVPPDAPETIVNTALVEGTGAETSVSAQASASLFVIRPGLSLVKTAEQTGAAPGDFIDYVIEVTNTGNVPLTNLTLSDSTLGFSENIPLLEAGASILFAPSQIVPAGTPGGTVITNTAVVAGSGLSASGSVSVTVLSIPSLSLTKTADLPLPLPGETVTFTITTSNTGNVPLTALRITDGLLGVDTTIPVLGPEETVPLTGTFTVPLGTPPGTVITNQASAVSDQTPAVTAEATVTVAPAPAITLVKTADRLTALPGETVTFTLTVANPSAQVLTGVTVTDAVLGLDRNLGTLAPGQTQTLFASFTIPFRTPAGTLIINTAQAQSAETVPVTASVTVTVGAAPSVAFIKLVSDEEAPAGGEIAFGFVLVNTGNVTLTNIRIADPVLEATFSLNSLAPGESQGQVVPFRLPEGLAPGTVFTNTAELRSDQTAPVVSAVDIRILPPPNISIMVTPNPEFVRPGERVPVMVTVTNPSNVVLNNVLVSNSLLGLNENISMLVPGGTATFTAVINVPPGTPAGTQIPGVVSLTSNETPEESAPFLVIVAPVPELVLRKQASTPVAVAGETVRYRIEALNIGNTLLTGVLNDPRVGVTIGPGTLPFGGGVLLSQPFRIPPETPAGTLFVNRVTAVSETGGSLEAAASVRVIRVLDVFKNADTEESFIGDEFRYTINVKNVSGLTATGAVLTDLLPPAVSFVPDSVVVRGAVVSGAGPETGIPLGSVAPGETVAVSFRVRVVSLDPSEGGQGSQQAGSGGRDRRLVNTAEVTYGVRSPSGRDIVTVAVSNASVVRITENEE
ncbi:CARDB domain-containing protein [Paenibacillus sp. UNC499MF]|uniref:DUF7507 domain-containing protein n=1 Tax=Paenibacillus sp. UNC499MF TaxID=1502751 RepID=UPI00089FAFCB|nr:CARDB domain-containing protein [Paenibacillus sp. UNC499MF]SEG05365.1 conserved repeat domain-containing protein [Paenibacillus sp. UNC499MF]